MVTVTEFNDHRPEPPNEIARTGEPTPMAVPLPPVVDKRWKLGRFRADAKVTCDIVAPLDEPWEALH